MEKVLLFNYFNTSIVGITKTVAMIFVRRVQNSNRVIVDDIRTYLF